MLSDYLNSKNTSSGSLTGSRNSEPNSLNSASSKGVGYGSLRSDMESEMALMDLNISFLEKFQEIKRISGIKKFINLPQIWDQYSRLKIEESNYDRLYEIFDKLIRVQKFYSIKEEFEELPILKEKDGADSLSRYEMLGPKVEGREIGVIVCKKNKPDREFLVKEYLNYFEAINEVLTSAGMRAFLGDIIPKNKIVKSADGRVLLFSRMLKGFKAMDRFYPRDITQKDALIKASNELAGFMRLKAAHMFFQNLDDNMFNDGVIEIEEAKFVAASVDFGRAMSFRFHSDLMSPYAYLTERYKDGEIIHPIDVLRIKIDSHCNHPCEIYLNPEYIKELRAICDFYIDHRSNFYSAIEGAINNIKQNFTDEEIQNYALFIGASNDLKDSLRQAFDLRVGQLKELADNLELECLSTQQDIALSLCSKLTPDKLIKKISWLKHDEDESVVARALQIIQEYLEQESGVGIKNCLNALSFITMVPKQLLNVNLRTLDDFSSKTHYKKFINIFYVKLSKDYPDIIDSHKAISQELKDENCLRFKEIRSFYVPRISKTRYLITNNSEEQKSILDKLSDAFKKHSPFDKEKGLYSIIAISLEVNLDSKQRGSKWIESSVQSFLNFLASDKLISRSENIVKWRSEIGLSDDILKNLSTKVQRSR